MSKCALTDSMLFFKPSKRMVEFIKKFEDSGKTKIPQGIARIFNNSDTAVDEKRIPVEYRSLLDDRDVEVLKQLFDVDDVPQTCVFDDENSQKGDDKSDTCLLNYEDLLWVYDVVQNCDDEVFFHQLMDGTKLLLPENYVRPRNPELEKRCEKLRLQQENDMYLKMTRNVDGVRSRHPEDTIAYQMKQLNAQLIAVFQFVVSVITGFAFGFLGIEVMVGELDFGFRLLLGITCALIVALAEIYFLAKALNKEYDDAVVNSTSEKMGFDGKTKTD